MIRAIFTSESSGSQLRFHNNAELLKGKGIKGDRYFSGKGKYSGIKKWDANLTIISEEPFLELKKKEGIFIDPKDLRRNIIVKDTNLSEFVGREFKIGNEVICKGRDYWTPCAYIVELTGHKEIFKYLARHCGIGVDVIKSGKIKRGDKLELLNNTI